MWLERVVGWTIKSLVMWWRSTMNEQAMRDSIWLRFPELDIHTRDLCGPALCFIHATLAPVPVVRVRQVK